MSRKNAAQKAKAAAAAQATKKPLPKQSKRNNQDGQPNPKKVKFSHPAPSGDSDVQPSSAAVSNLPHTAAALGARQPGHARSKPPEGPDSVDSKTMILPLEADDAKLREKYDLHMIAINPNVKMESRIKAALEALSSEHMNEKKALVALTSNSRAANKCIGVAEIVKREALRGMSAATGSKPEAKIYQYTGCWTRLETHRPKAKGETSTDTPKRADDDVEDDEEVEDKNAFEAAVVTEQRRVRNNTCMVIYLSREPVQRLRERYGQQAQEADKG